MEIKERIKEKADELFRRYGIKSVTMDEIANQLGVSKKTIYHSFSDKNELVDEVIADILQYNKDCCKSYRANSNNAIHEIYQAMEMLQIMFDNMNPVILYDIERNHPATYKKFAEYKYKFLYEMVKENIERGKKEELYRSDIETDVVAKVRLETMMMPFNEEIFPKNKFSLATLQQQLIEYFLFGIASMKGYKLILKYHQERSGSKSVKIN
ncbi:MAG: TetR/AcrR family transcriptional regulator [Bacteroidota bacterium]|nr:TetR/AcrR family transcriptional regulator [Bacteroidota bacterium]